MEIKDAKGRAFTTKEMDPGDLLELLEASGANSGNAAWVRLAMVICSVTAIDGVPVPAATKKQDVVATAKRIGNDGLVALNAAMFGDDAKPEAPTADADALEAAKN